MGYYIIITHYVIISHYYLLLTGQLADVAGGGADAGGPLIRGGAAGTLPPDLWGVAVRAVDDRLGSEARGPLP